MASPLPFMLGRRVRSNKDTFVDPSEREPEAPAPAPPPVVGQPIVFAQPAPDAVVEEAEAPPSTSEGLVRCSRSHKGKGWRCKRMFLPEMSFKGEPLRSCERCRATTIRFTKTEKFKASQQRFRSSDKGKTTVKRASTRYKTSEAGKASQHRANTTASARIGKKISKLCRDSGIDSVSAMEATGCTSTEELRAHFESTFEPWMNWANHGAHKAGGNSEAWQIGHRLARAFYDDSNPADIKRCWNKANLFAQDADENHALSVKMPDDAVLERLRALDLLPCAWGGIVPPAAKRTEMERTASLPVALR
jgi:hypothetical protein